ncbi:MAG: prepilin-type N-terminal cleavage/methylation domain-containing protein [Proteobacteria bacterium]|nr:prepilin-type N-terminal cleavage/methylation domain-containing protein [Pseudomonadota bacterium]
MQSNRAEFSQQGFGLLEVLIAAGIFAIIAAALSNNAVFSINAQRTTELRGDKEAFKKRILEHYSCYNTKTIPSSKCKNPDEYIYLEDTSGDILIPKAGKTIGNWTYIAECRTAAGAINIRAVHLAPNIFLDPSKLDLDNLVPGTKLDQDISYIKDPLTKKIIKIKDPDSFLFRPDLNPQDRQLCDGTRPPKLVPFYGHYPTGQFNSSFPRDVKGTPKFVTVFSPNKDKPLPPPADYCIKTADMVGPNLHVCGPYKSQGGNYSITLDATGFTVSGDLVKASPSPRAYQEWVYFGFKDVAN